MTTAREPGSTRAFPWRFTLGQNVYTTHQLTERPLKIIGGELWLGFPHLHLLDENGHQWRVPQLHCSSKPTIT